MLFWCLKKNLNVFKEKSLVGADRPPKQSMPVARPEDLGLCVLWSLSLSLQSVLYKSGVVCLENEELMFWCVKKNLNFLVGRIGPST